MATRELTDKQKKFADLILTGQYSQAECYRRAGYTAGGAPTLASRLLHNDAVQRYLENSREIIRYNSILNAGKIVERLSDIAECDVEDLFDISDDGTIALVPKCQRSRKVRRAIKKIKIKHDKDGNQDIEVELHDKLKAIEMLGKHFGMFNQKIDLSVTDGTKEQEMKAMFDSMTTEEKLAWLEKNS